MKCKHTFISLKFNRAKSGVYTQFCCKCQKWIKLNKRGLNMDNLTRAIISQREEPKKD